MYIKLRQRSQDPQLPTCQLSSPIVNMLLNAALTTLAATAVMAHGSHDAHRDNVMNAIVDGVQDVGKQDPHVCPALLKAQQASTDIAAKMGFTFDYLKCQDHDHHDKHHLHEKICHGLLDAEDSQTALAARTMEIHRKHCFDNKEDGNYEVMCKYMRK